MQSTSKAALWSIIVALLAASLPIKAQDKSMLLLAEPGMESAVFANSVVLVTPQSRGAAFGVILNHPIPTDPAQLYPEDELLRELSVIYFGGPVHPDSMVFLFRSEDQPDNALHLFADVYLSGDRKLLAEQIPRPRDESGLQVYVGFAGWAPGQLQMELGMGAWQTRPISIKTLYETDRKSIWQMLSGDSKDGWI